MSEVGLVTNVIMLTTDDFRWVGRRIPTGV